MSDFEPGCLCIHKSDDPGMWRGSNVYAVRRLAASLLKRVIGLVLFRHSAEKGIVMANLAKSIALARDIVGPILRPSELREFGILTGSRAFGVPTDRSDYDWLVDSSMAPALGVPRPKLGESHNLRQGNLNLIVCDYKFREKWMRAHRHCQIEQPRSKARRIAIFHHYMRGTFLM